MKALLLFISLLISFRGPTEEALLKSGYEAENSGNYEQALEIWGSALTTLEAPSLGIGREYIRLTTEQMLKDKYKSASVMYLWGLSANQVKPNKDALENEIAFLEPLIDLFDIKELSEDLTNEDPVIYDKLRSFWEQLDPTPSTAYNERLLEHWERIAYAREHFTRNDNSVYGTDDRGEIYVEYGKPESRWSGQLTVTQSMIEMACQKLIGCPEASQVYKYHSDPEYEVWSYQKPSSEMRFDMLHIFGTDKYGGFNKVNTIEDLITDNAFSLGNRYNKFDYSESRSVSEMSSGSFNPRLYDPPSSSLSPGMVLTFIYTDRIKSYHEIFALKFSTLDWEWTNPDPNDPPQKYMGHTEKQRSLRIALEEQNAAPEEFSTYQNEFPAIPLEVYHYRLLNRDGKPVTASFVQSRPRRVFLEDVAHNQEALIGEDSTSISLAPYELFHGLVIRDKEGNRISQGRQQAQLIIDRSEEDLPSSSVFMVPQEIGEQVQFYAQLHNEHPETQPRYESSFEPSMRGIGQLESELPEPLSTDQTELQMSDLILGYDMNPDAEEQVLFPFYVSHSRTIPQGKELALHFEVYHLDQDPGGIGSFDLEYSITPKGRMDWIKSPENEITLTLDFRTNANRFSEDLGIQTRELKPGRYTLEMTATDRESGQKAEREVVFEVF